MRTAFQGKVQGSLDAMLDSADAQTRALFSRYQHHFEQVFREAAQDPEEVTEVGARQGPGSGDALEAWHPALPARCLSPQVFLTALRAPQPALRYFASERILPLVRLRLADPSGRSYVAAMHRTVFSDKPAEGLDGAQAEAGAGELGGPEFGAPPAAPK